jgi:hypothetical protein
MFSQFFTPFESIALLSFLTTHVWAEELFNLFGVLFVPMAPQDV